MREELYGDSKIEALLEFATSVKCSYWVQLWAGCSHMLLVYMGQVWQTSASSHQPLFASVEPRLDVLNKCEMPDEA